MLLNIILVHVFYFYLQEGKLLKRMKCYWDSYRKIIKTLHYNCAQFESEFTLYWHCQQFSSWMYRRIKFIVMCSPFPQPSSFYLIFSTTKDDYKSNEGKYSPENNQSRKRTSGPGVFSWRRELTCGEQVIKAKQAGPEKRGSHRSWSGKAGDVPQSRGGESSWEFWEASGLLRTSFVFILLWIFEEVRKSI